jgi:hypothetical protein
MQTVGHSSGDTNKMIKLDEIKKQIVEIKDLNEFFSIHNKDANTSAKNWFFATIELEKSLDTFMQQLAAVDKITAIKFSTVFAKYAFDYVRKNHLDQVKEFGFAFLESDPCLDGEPIEKQIKNVENWLNDPTKENMKIVQKGIDPSRQMNIWEEDLFPPDDQMWAWIIENTQLLSMAIVAGDSEQYDYDMEKSPYSWSYKACVSRSAICSLKSIAKKDRTLEKDLINLFRKVGEEL